MTNSHISRHAGLTEMALRQHVGVFCPPPGIPAPLFSSFLSSVLHWALDDTQNRRIITHFHYFANINHLPRCSQQYCAMVSPLLLSSTTTNGCYIKANADDEFHCLFSVIHPYIGFIVMKRQTSLSEYDFVNFLSVGIFNYLCVHLSEKEKIAMLV